MQRIGPYIYQKPEWPAFKWKAESVTTVLAEVRHRQGRLLGKMEGLGFTFREEASLQTLTDEIIKSSDIEGEVLPADQVRSSIARRLGINIGGLVPSDRAIEGVVAMMLDATQNFNEPLTAERLFGWHASLFPNGYSGTHKITVGTWRNDHDGPMEVISGAMGKEKVHFVAPAADRLDGEMTQFLNWFNQDQPLDSVLKAAIAHLWFVTIHPFEDGNGRIARAIADMQLAKSDKSQQRFYSMSVQIRKVRNEYYECLERTQQGTLDITRWLLWFLDCLNNTFNSVEENLERIFRKAKFWENHQAVLLNQRQKVMLNKLLDGFEGKLTSSKWAIITKCSPDTALRDIQLLLEAGMLEKEPAGGRSTNYRIKL